MTFAKQVCLAALIITAVSGCSAESGGDSVFTHLTLLNSQQIAVHRHIGPDAIVTAAGEISIDGKSLTLDQKQKDLVIKYFSGASALRKDGLATGMAGADTAMTALTSVARGLASGNPDKIGQDVEAKAAQVEAQAIKLCGELRELASTQNALAASLADFKPYALIDAQTVDECHA